MSQFETILTGEGHALTVREVSRTEWRDDVPLDRSYYRLDADGTPRFYEVLSRVDR